MNMYDFFDYKNRLMEDLLTNETIVRLLDDSIDISDAGKLMYKQVFPYEYIPDTIEHGHTYICCDVDVRSPSYRATTAKSTFYYPELYIWIMSHESKLRLPNGAGVRTDRLCAEIANAINASMYYGIGKLELYAVKRFAPIVNWQGKVLAFTTTEWNAPYNPHKSVPANRKAGI